MSHFSFNHDLRRRPRKKPHMAMRREVRSSGSRVRRSGEVREETCLKIAPDVQWPKIALGAAERLQRVRWAPPVIPPAEVGSAEEVAGTAEEMVGTAHPAVGAHRGPTNWHDWHTPLADDLVATGQCEGESQGVVMPGVGA